jgi:hypothetical protein
VSESSDRILADGGYFESSGADTAMDLVRQIRGLGQTPSCPPGKVAGSDPCDCPIVIAARFSQRATWSNCTIPIFIAYLPMIASSSRDDQDGPRPWQSYVLDPLSTILGTRTTHGRLAVDRARSSFAPPDDPTLPPGMSVDPTSADYGFFLHELPVEDLGLPLGWKLSRKAALDVRTYAAPTRACKDVTDTQPPPRATQERDSPDAAPSRRIETIAYDNGCDMRMLASLFNPSGRTGGIELTER